MAVAAAAALLDELMGRSRNEADGVAKKNIRWDDPEYCKYYMVQFCPHDLFVNTKADLGPCSKVHCDEAKFQFEQIESYRKYQYEEDFIRFAQNMLNDVERKIAKGEQRLALMGKADPLPQLSSAQTEKNEEQISLLNEKINSLVNEAEQMGIQGNVEKAQGLMKLCDQLKEERDALRNRNETSHWSATVELAVSQEKQMEVCKVCGAFLIIGDAQSRIDDHLMGKQHTGYRRLKAGIDEILNRREEERQEKEKRREEERMKRTTERESKLRDGSKSRGLDDDKSNNKDDDRSDIRKKETDRTIDGKRSDRRDRDRSTDRRYDRTEHHDRVDRKEKDRDRTDDRHNGRRDDRYRDRDRENYGRRERDRSSDRRSDRRDRGRLDDRRNERTDRDRRRERDYDIKDRNDDRGREDRSRRSRDRKNYGDEEKSKDRIRDHRSSSHRGNSRHNGRSRSRDDRTNREDGKRKRSEKYEKDSDGADVNTNGEKRRSRT